MTEEIGALRLQTITHALIGGYNATTKSEELGIAEYPRPTAVRGAMRWWLRALLAGALWESGEKERVRERVREKVRGIMGATESSSRVAIWLEYGRRPDVVQVPKSPLSEVPRLNLLLLARSGLYCYKPGWSITLHLTATRQIDERAKRVVLWSAALYSIFGGIGAITRRGFGALRIEKIDGQPDISDLTAGIYRDPNHQRLREIIENALGDARDFMGISEGNGSNGLPPFPLLSTKSDVFRYEFLNISVPHGSEENESEKVLSKIGKSTLKVEWKRADGKSPRESGKQYDTWILGLPRAVKGTGYFELNGKEGRSKEGRRVSAISMKPIKRGEGGKWTLLMYGFLSRDWPRRLEIKPGGSEISRDDEKMISAFENAWGKIKALVR
jgi:CRISPR-associated protein Cmr1